MKLLDNLMNIAEYSRVCKRKVDPCGLKKKKKTGFKIKRLSVITGKVVSMDIEPFCKKLFNLSSSLPLNLCSDIFL